MPSIFSKIVSGELPCHKLKEDDRFLSFLEIRPLKPGHALAIPKREIDYLYDLDDRTLGDLFVFAKGVAAAIKKSIPCRKVGTLVYGLEVPHAHVHLVPIDGTRGELDFANAKPADPAELARIAELIRKNIV